jgi:hypothetical protein
MIQLITKNQLQDLAKYAKEETVNMIDQKIDISDPCLVTPLEELANQYPEIAEECNRILLELIKQNIRIISEKQAPEIINEF